MDINNLIKSIKPSHYSDIKSFVVSYNLLKSTVKKKYYNDLILKNVDEKYGVYIWVNNSNNEIIYIGMSGKINRDGKFFGQKLNKRLLNTRGKLQNYKGGVSTEKYLSFIMKECNILEIDFYIIYTSTEIPPSYIEAQLIFQYYYNLKKLPILNQSF